MNDLRFVTLDPGHFHAALVQKTMLPGVARQTHIYAPFGPDLLAHLQRLAGFNARAEQPTAWELDIHAAPDYLARLLRDKPGHIVVLSGKNRQKIDYLETAVQAGLHVLADKPWIIRAADLPRLETVLRQAEERGLVAYDMMTERHEITSILQRALVQDRALFGTLEAGDERGPGVFMESVHYLRKQVAGVPLRRPPWFFDIHQAGEGLTDVGTHLVDLVPWLLFPEQPLDWQQDVQLLSARRWPTEMTRNQFRDVTGEADFPAYLEPAVEKGRLAYFCNNFVSYRLRGNHVQLNVLWDYESAGGGDTHLAVVCGSRARIEVRQGAAENYRPEVYVVPQVPSDRAGVQGALEMKIAALQATYPGLAVVERGEALGVAIPDRYRIGHEAHFAQVTEQFLHYVQQPGTLPAWEKPNMLAKYRVTTGGVALAQP